MNRELSCENCGARFHPSPHPRARLAVAGAAALVGGAATESILGGLLVGGAGYLMAAAADEYYFSRRCPQCGSLGAPMHNGRGEEAEPAEVETSPGSARST
jgi:hypothetical protein